MAQITAPPLTTPPQGVNPFQAHPAGGVWTGQQWVPGDHPLAAPFRTPTQTTPTPTPPMAQGPGLLPAPPPLPTPQVPTATAAPPPVPQKLPLPPPAVPAPTTTPAPAPPAAQLPTGTAPVTQQPAVAGTGGTPPTINSTFRDAMVRALSQNQTPSLSDPTLAPQVGAFRQAQARAEERAQSGLAERRGAEGSLGSGAFAGELNKLGEARGLAEGQFEAGLLGQEASARREELQRMLVLAGGMLSDSERNQLQREIANLEAQEAAASRGLQRELGLSGLGLEERLGLGDLGLRQQLGMGDLGLRQQLGLGELGLQERLGIGDLGLRQALGLGGLNLQQQELGLQERLGQRGLDIEQLLGLGDIDVRRQGIETQGELGRGDLGLRGELGRGQLGLGLLDLLLGDRYRNSALGINTSLGVAGLNQNALLALLGQGG